MIRIQEATGPGYTRTRRALGIRQASSGDCEAIKDFLAGLSPRTRYLRFFTGAPTANTAALRRLAGDGEGIDAVVATEAGTIIGHAMAADTTGPAGTRVTEIGVAVTDTRQGQGVGTALTRELAQRARARGATTLAMDVLAENRRVMTMIADHWPAAHYDRSGPYVTVYAGLTRPGEAADVPEPAQAASAELSGEATGAATPPEGSGPVRDFPGFVIRAHLIRPVEVADVAPVPEGVAS